MRVQCSKRSQCLLFCDFENSRADRLPPSCDGVSPGEVNCDADSGKEVVRHTFLELLADVLGAEQGDEVRIGLECLHLYNLESFRVNPLNSLAPVLFVSRFDHCQRVQFIRWISRVILAEKAALFLSFQALLSQRGFNYSEHHRLFEAESTHKVYIYIIVQARIDRFGPTIGLIGPGLLFLAMTRSLLGVADMRWPMTLPLGEAILGMAALA